MTIVLVTIGLILFVGLVIAHEYGHFLAARRNGVDVEEFGIGFPPKAWSRKLKSGMLFSINVLPLGGFVRLKGEHDADKGKGTYGAASLKTKTKIMTAGVGMNLLVAFLLLTVLAWLGMPKVIDNQFGIASDSRTIKNQVLVGYIESDSPAAKAGLHRGDQIVSIQGDNNQINYINDTASLPKVTQRFAGQTVDVEANRQGQKIMTSLQLRSTEEVDKSKNTDNPKGYMGIVPTEYTIVRSTWSAPVVAMGMIVQLTAATLNGIAQALAGLFTWNTQQATQQIAGPVGIFVLLKDGSVMGYQFVLLIVAIISLTLAIMNILPIPALDGGRLFVTWLYRFMRRPLTQKTEELIHGAGFALLMVLFIVITVVDVKRFF